MRVHCINENKNYVRRRSLINIRWFFNSSKKYGNDIGGIELLLFSKETRWLNFKIGFSKMYVDEHTFSTAFCIPFILALYTNWNIPFLEKRKWYSKWLGEDDTIRKVHWGECMTSHARERTLQFNVFDSYASINLFSFDRYETGTIDNYKWQTLSFDWKDFLLGNLKTKKRTLLKEDVLVPLPEKEYAAKCHIYEIVQSRKRWFSKKYIRGEIECKEGIPVPGKGTESYNCGEDCTHSISILLNDVVDYNFKKPISKLIGEMVANVCYKRNSYPL